ncbi:MAG: TonB-dependent receptor [Pseudomonadota bacterium]
MLLGRHSRAWLRAPGFYAAALALAGALSLSPMDAGAQEATDGFGAEDPFVLPEIVLRGTLADREFTETVESVGILTGDDILDQGVDDLRESFQRFGNVRQFEGNRGESGFVIRGLSTDGITESSNNSDLTSIIIDGVSQTGEAARRGARGLWDVQQVEVFRGPQSTLQGRSSLAGAVIVESNDPTFFFESRLRGIAGSEEQNEGAFMLSGPLNEAGSLAGRISGELRERERGISFNIPENEVLGRDEFRSLRAKLLFEPPDLPGLTATLTFSDVYDKPGIAASNSEDFFDREFNSAPTTAVEIREARNRNLSLEVEYDLGENLSLTSITAFTDTDLQITTPEGFTFSRDESRGGRDFTQDLRLTFGGEDSDLKGVIGLFAGRFTLPRDSFVTFGPTVIQDLTSDDRTLNLSIYADATWRFAPSWSLIAGGRITYERVTEDQSGIAGGGRRIDFEDSIENVVGLPKIGLTYHISEDQTLSFSARRGYRSGFTAIEDPAGPTDVDPEFLTSYELAYRAEAPDGRWRFGATAFYSLYEDQQIVVPAVFPEPTRTLNAGKSELYGAEIEGNYAFRNGLSVFGSMGLLQTNFIDFVTADGNLSGNEFPEAPNVTAALGVSYTDPSGFFVSGTASYTGSYFSTGSIDNDPALEVDAFTRVDVQAGYAFDGGRVVFYADNLFDSDHVTSLVNRGFGSDPIEAIVSEPRRFGVELTAEF